MNEIRKNNEDEKILIEGTFKLSPGAILFALVGILILGGILLGVLLGAESMEGEINGQPASGWAIAYPIVIMFGLVFVAFVAFQVLKLIAIFKSKLVVTNKRIYGVYSILISHKQFSYRLDEIENVEMLSALGQHTVAIQFTQGYGTSLMMTTYSNGVPTSYGFNMLRMSNLKNYKEVYETLNGLITDHKNLVDVRTDIEMGKLNAENRKADALEKMAIGVPSNGKAADYIDELKRLKELLDQGIITKEEFEQEKKEILANNHR